MLIGLSVLWLPSSSTGTFSATITRTYYVRSRFLLPWRLRFSFSLVVVVVGVDDDDDDDDDDVVVSGGSYSRLCTLFILH